MLSTYLRCLTKGKITAVRNILKSLLNAKLYKSVFYELRGLNFESHEGNIDKKTGQRNKQGSLFYKVNVYWVAK